MRGLPAGIAPEMAAGMIGGRLVAAFDRDSNRITLPPHVLAMTPQQQMKWGKKRGITIVPEVSGGTSYGMFEMLAPAQTADATAVTAAAQTALTPDAIFTLAGNSLRTGQVLWFRVMGKQSNVVTTPGTYLFRLFYGGIAGTALVASAAITPNPVAVTDNLFFVDMWIHVVAANYPSATGLTLVAYGQVSMANEIVPTTNALWQARYMPPGATALADVASLDPTTAKALTLAVTPSVATGSIAARRAFLVSTN